MGWPRSTSSLYAAVQLTCIVRAPVTDMILGKTGRLGELSFFSCTSFQYISLFQSFSPLLSSTSFSFESPISWFMIMRGTRKFCLFLFETYLHTLAHVHTLSSLIPPCCRAMLVCKSLTLLLPPTRSSPLPQKTLFTFTLSFHRCPERCMVSSMSQAQAPSKHALLYTNIGGVPMSTPTLYRTTTTTTTTKVLK